jgi:hypothetical protein
LALAHYRAGDWEAAEDAILKSIDLTGKDVQLTGPAIGDGYRGLLASMIVARRGHFDKARQWHKIALEWASKDNTQDPFLAELIAESNALFSGAPTEKTDPTTIEQSPTGSED